MVLMKLLAQLTLDKTAFDTDLKQAETDAKNFQNPEPKLELETENYDEALKKAQQGSSEFKGIWDDLVYAVATAGITATISGVISYLGNAMDAFLNAGQAINDTSKAWGISAQAYQEWSHVLSGSRADIKDLEGGVKNINKLLGGDAPDKVAAAFKAIGVSAEDADGKLKSTEQLLSETIYTLANYDGNDRISLVETIFGKNGANLNQMLDKGQTGIKGLVREAHNFGLVMSDEQIDTALGFDQAMTNLHDAMSSFQKDIGEFIVPGLTNVVEQMTKIVNFFSGNHQENTLDNTLKDITKGLAGESKEAENTAAEAKGLVDMLWSMGDATKLTAEQQELWKGTAEELIKLIPDLGEVIDTDTGKISANKDEIYATIDAWKAYQKQRALAAAEEEAGQAVLEKYTEWLTAQTDANIAANKAEVARQNAISDINKILAEQGLSIDKSLSGTDIFQAVQDLGTAVGRGDKNAIAQIYQDYLDVVGVADDAADKAADIRKEYDDANDSFEEYVTELRAVADGEDAVNTTNEAISQTGANAVTATGEVETLNSAVDELQSKSPVTIQVQSEGLFDGEYNAKGNWSVPYDNFPAVLHRGEQVLTASDARKYREKKGSDFDVEGLASAIVGAIRTGMEDANVNAFMNGRRVTKETNRVTGELMSARRYAPA